MITIINLTPHPVTIIRAGREPVTFPACVPADLPRAVEGVIESAEMALTDGGSDGQGGYENSHSLDGTGLVEQRVAYTGVEGLADFAPGERMFGVSTFRIVSIVTAIGALASGRGIEDLLIPMGQVRDAAGRIVGATSLAPATSLLTPMYRAIAMPLRKEIQTALEARNEAQRMQRLAEERATSMRHLVDGAS